MKNIKLPDIPEEAKTPLVNRLLAIIESLAEEIQILKDEILLL